MTNCDIISYNIICFFAPQEKRSILISCSSANKNTFVSNFHNNKQLLQGNSQNCRLSFFSCRLSEPLWCRTIVISNSSLISQPDISLSDYCSNSLRNVPFAVVFSDPAEHWSADQTDADENSRCWIMAELQISHYLASLKANSSASHVKHNTRQSYTPSQHLHRTAPWKKYFSFCIHGSMCLFFRSLRVGDG